MVHEPKPAFSGQIFHMVSPEGEWWNTWQGSWIPNTIESLTSMIEKQNISLASTGVSGDIKPNIRWDQTKTIEQLLKLGGELPTPLTADEISLMNLKRLLVQKLQQFSNSRNKQTRASLSAQIKSIKSQIAIIELRISAIPIVEPDIEIAVETEVIKVPIETGLFEPIIVQPETNIVPVEAGMINDQDVNFENSFIPTQLGTASEIGLDQVSLIEIPQPEKAKSIKDLILPLAALFIASGG